MEFLFSGTLQTPCPRSRTSSMQKVGSDFGKPVIRSYSFDAGAWNISLETYPHTQSDEYLGIFQISLDSEYHRLKSRIPNFGFSVLDHLRGERPSPAFWAVFVIARTWNDLVHYKTLFEYRNIKHRVLFLTYGGFSNIDNGKEKSQHTSEEEKTWTTTKATKPRTPAARCPSKTTLGNNLI